VTLTVGGNDLHVAAVATACAADPTSQPCKAAIAYALSLLAPSPTGGPGVLASSLSDVYTAIATAAPRAKILVTGYPYLFDTPTPCTPAEAIVCQINYATTLLNQTIATTVAAMPDSVDIEYVDVTDAFTGHGIGSPNPFINGPELEDAYHPNDAGYRAYAEALIAALRQTG
jgi:lysophospholipase L1-like esterase